MAEPDRDQLLLEEQFPEGPIEDAGQLRAYIVDDPRRVVLQFESSKEDLLYRVFLDPQQFYGVLELLLTVGRDLNAILVSRREDNLGS